jgi:hypothetical protein
MLVSKHLSQHCEFVRFGAPQNTHAQSPFILHAKKKLSPLAPKDHLAMSTLKESVEFY